MTIRILQIADTMPSPDSGASGTDFQGMLALQRAGAKVDALWTADLGRRIKHYNLRYVYELPTVLRQVVKSKMKMCHYDVVQISQPHGYLAARWIRQNRPETVYVHRTHGFEARVEDALKHWRKMYANERSGLRGWAQQGMAMLLRRNYSGIALHASGHLVSASECSTFLREHYAVPEKRISVIPQAVTTPFLQSASTVNPERLRRLLYVGQHAFVKAPHVLGKIVSHVLARRPQFHFTWVCAVEQHEALKAYFDPAVLERVAFVPNMPQDQLTALYDSHGIFIFPSFFEGFGKAFLEAMSRGLVVIASDNGGMRDIIKSGHNGLKFETGDFIRAADLVLQVADNPGFAQALSRPAIATSNELTWDRFASESLHFYQRLQSLRI
jgi:glycosyltransferase involved in cell wall biosynthesis